MLHRDHTVILNLVDKLYAAALNDREWADFLSSAAEAVGADHAFVCQLDLHQRALSYVGLQQGNRTAVPVRRYGTLLNDDPRRTIFDSRPNEASHCRMGLSQARLHGSRTYRNYLRPLNIEYTMVACLPVRDGFSHDLGFTRTRARTAFRRDDCDLLNELIPHLRRAFEISRVLAERATPIPPRQVDCDHLKLQTCLALSPRQARLAALLFDGKSVKDAARELRITEGSARQYLRKVFEKTGVKRQLDLIRVIEGALARNG
ncbi:helix-turn-helix transcriptional regulator [Afipia sp. GAS231]|uniref:helix-turn-helix transcriptional regulator n=1 Tax=Afipia sp. GAS231 TaxID=1882747 RepID=UPI00087D6E9D|nr:helix-turn-helix transcriptional regulator [Afipia sp. GAS231]SDO71434.1 regulatory protein, luxR family [Afipia sp. GAS231]